MRSLLTITLGLFALAAACSINAQEPRAELLSDHLKKFVATDAPLIAITNVRVVTGDGSSARRGQTILIRDGEIAEIGGAVQIPGEAEIFAGDGMTALPGLVMMHEHLFYPANKGQTGNYGDVQPIAFPRLYLAHGVTTMRTAGSMEPVNELQIKRGILEGRYIGPDMDVTGPYLEGVGSFLDQAEPVETPQEARRIVKFWAAQGATSFKAYNFISRDVLSAVINEAHKHDMKVTGHLCSVTFSEAAALGIDNLEHGLNSATDFMIGKKPDQCKMYNAARYVTSLDIDAAPVQTLIKTLIDSDVAITSTLAVFADFGSRTTRPTEKALASLSDETRIRYQQTKMHFPPAAAAMADEALVTEMAFQRAFVDAGGLLLAGTDPTGLGGSIAGFGTLWQLELLVEAGFTPLEAIKIATYNGALYLEQLDMIGTLARGKSADIMLVRGMPDKDIADIRNVEIVFKHGVAYKSADLITSVEGLVGK